MIARPSRWTVTYVCIHTHKQCFAPVNRVCVSPLAHKQPCTRECSICLRRQNSNGARDQDRYTPCPIISAIRDFVFCSSCCCLVSKLFEWFSPACEYWLGSYKFFLRGRTTRIKPCGHDHIGVSATHDSFANRYRTDAYIMASARVVCGTQFNAIHAYSVTDRCWSNVVNIAQCELQITQYDAYNIVVWNLIQINRKSQVWIVRFY